jgi:hypothetical protein
LASKDPDPSQVNDDQDADPDRDPYDQIFKKVTAKNDIFDPKL